MLKVGDTIKQVNPIKGFNFVGEKFTITDIQCDSISFTNSRMGNGIMNYDEFKKYFTILIIREWVKVTDEKLFPEEIRNNCEFECLHNGKKVIIRSLNCNNKKIKGVASCCPDDEFDLEYGIKLALKRYLENLLKELN